MPTDYKIVTDFLISICRSLIVSSIRCRKVKSIKVNFYADKLLVILGK